MTGTNAAPTSGQTPVKYQDFDVEETLAKLTTHEKISLISGTDFWHLAGIPRLGIPAIRTSDGPNGVRGTTFFNGVPAACLPCGERSSLIHSPFVNTDSF